MLVFLLLHIFQRSGFCSRNIRIQVGILLRYSCYILGVPCARGPNDHISTRILHSGSEGHVKGDTRNHGLVGSLCPMWPLRALHSSPLAADTRAVVASTGSGKQN